MLEERRRHIRAPIASKVILIGKDDPLVHFSRNISISGMFIESTKPFPVDTEMYLFFSLHDLEKTVRTQAKVVRVVDPVVNNDFVIPGMGFEFQESPFGSSVLIEDYIIKIKNIYEELAIILNMFSPDIKRLNQLLKKANLSGYKDMFELKEAVKRDCIALGIVT